jgi:outer membrane protein TolC
VDLEIRSKYQQWLKAQDSLKQTERSLQRAKVNLEIVTTRQAIGSAQPYEGKTAEALLQRAEWNVLSATVEQEKARLAAADAAAYLYEIETRLRRSK